MPVAFDSFAVQRGNVVLKGTQHGSKQLQQVSVVFGRSLSQWVGGSSPPRFTKDSPTSDWSMR